MKLFGADTNSGMIRKISDWFGMNFNPKLSPGHQYTRKVPKFRMGIYYSEPFRIIPKNLCISDSMWVNLYHSEICIRSNVNQSEPIWKSFQFHCLKIAWKLICLDPILLSEWIRTNPNHCFNPNEWEPVHTQVDSKQNFPSQ